MPRVFQWLVLLALSFPMLTHAATTLENPAPGALKSGVGLLSGWSCDADYLEVSFDGGPKQFVPYGSDRADTAGVCGDSDNGFGLLINYNNLGNGPHTVTLYDDGAAITQVNFTVQTLGTDFLRGVTGQGTVTLSDGKEVSVQWEETTQGFTITGYTEPETEAPVTPPVVDSSGVGQFTGTWGFTARGGTNTLIYTFGDPEPCWVDLSNSGLQCVQDYLELATLGPATMTGFNSPYAYALIHQRAEDCLAFFFNEPVNGVVEGDYGRANGSCLDSAVVNAIAQQVYSGNYQITGRRTGVVASGNVCTTHRGLVIPDPDEDEGRWNVTNVCSPWHGYPNVLHIDIVPLTTYGYYIDIDEIVIRQGGLTWEYDYGDNGTAVWVDRNTLASIDGTILPYRVNEAQYRTTLVLGSDTGVDLSQPFTLYYDYWLVARFE